MQGDIQERLKVNLPKDKTRVPARVKIQVSF